jgi:hypothetical protein
MILTNKFCILKVRKYVYDYNTEFYEEQFDLVISVPAIKIDITTNFNNLDHGIRQKSKLISFGISIEISTNQFRLKP